MPIKQLVQKYFVIYGILPQAVLLTIFCIFYFFNLRELRSITETHILASAQPLIVQFQESADFSSLNQILTVTSVSLDWNQAYVINQDNLITASYPDPQRIGASIRSDSCKLSKPIVSQWGESVGRICWEPSKWGKFEISKYICGSFIIFLLFPLGLLARTLFRGIGTLTQELEVLADGMSSRHIDFTPVPNDYTSREGKILATSLISFKNEIIRLEQQAADYKVKEEIISISRQVAHDIRSPVTALRGLITFGVNNQEQKELLKSVTERIESIAEKLISDSRTLSLNLQKFDVAATVLAIVAEKRISGSSNISVNCPNDHLYLVGQKFEFEALLSNIINNSFEANASEIKINVKSSANWEIIEVLDNGKGMPKAILNEIGKTNISFDKPQGSGLGLSGAFKAIERWGGKIEIESMERIGTTVRIYLKRL